MTDEQIIDIFKYCTDSNSNNCYTCAAHQNGRCAVPDTDEQIARILEQQKAEIAQLNVELKAMRGAANSYRLECERLQKKTNVGKTVLWVHVCWKIAN